MSTSRAAAVAILGLMVIAAACSSGSFPPEATPESLVIVLDATPAATPLAVESVATSKPVKSGSFYTPPDWDGYSDVNCTDFDTHAHALSFFKGTGGSKTNDPYHLDNDHDGSPCESLP